MNDFIEILGTKVNNVSMNQALQQISIWTTQDDKHHIVTADAYMINLASTDKKLQDIINNASLVTPDSSGVLLSAKLLKKELKNKVSGCELAENICKISGANNIKIFFLGGKPGISELAAKKMKEKYKHMQIAGYYHGYFSEEENQQVLDIINSSNADVLFVAFGIPKQEFWINENLSKICVKVAIGIGGTFDVMSGTVDRAPVIYQKLYLEWLYRYFKDPKKSYKLKELPGYFLKVYKSRKK